MTTDRYRPALVPSPTSCLTWSDTTCPHSSACLLLRLVSLAPASTSSQDLLTEGSWSLSDHIRSHPWQPVALMTTPPCHLCNNVYRFSLPVSGCSLSICGTGSVSSPTPDPVCCPSLISSPSALLCLCSPTSRGLLAEPQPLNFSDSPHRYATSCHRLMPFWPPTARPVSSVP